MWNSNKFTSITNWCSGNFNGDNVVDTSDFNIWNSNKFTTADLILQRETDGKIEEGRASDVEVAVLIVEQTPASMLQGPVAVRIDFTDGIADRRGRLGRAMMPKTNVVEAVFGQKDVDDLLGNWWGF